MKGFKDKNKKFHPIRQSNGVRKSRDQNAKAKGIRKSRNRFHPKGYKPPIFGKKKPAGKWEITETDYSPNKTVWKVVIENPQAESGTNTHFITLGSQATIQDVKNALLRMYDYDHKTYMYFPQDLQFPNLHSIERQKRDSFDLPLKQRKVIAKELSDNDFVIIDQNPKWKLTHIVVDDGVEYYVFPDEDSALEFGIQSIRDTATDYIPDEGTERYDEYKDLEGEDLVDKIIEELSEYGQRSQLGAVAQSVAGYDGQYTELSDGTIAFRVS